MSTLLADSRVAGLLGAPASRKQLDKIPDTRPEVFGSPRAFLDHRFVYLTISPRARGLSIGINLNPDKKCNLDCLYCEVDRKMPSLESPLVRADLDLMAEELVELLAFVRSGEIREHPGYSSLPQDLLKLKHVALSGNGEPTLCPIFSEVIHSVLHVRARSNEFFKVVLITNGTALDALDVQLGIQYFTLQDEIWAKLDAGTPEYLREINRTDIPLEKILKNILETAKQRPVIIQSLFSVVDGVGPNSKEIDEYAQRLRELKKAGANIPLVQIYSATRPTATTRVTHLPLRTMAEIAATVRRVAGVRAEVF